MTLASVHSSTTVPSPLASPEAREDLNRYAEAGGFTLRAETHPWYAAFASVSRLEEARAASSILAEVRGHNVPDLQQAAERLASVRGFAAPTTVRETATLVSLLARVRATLDVLRPDTYLTEAHTLDALLAATATPAWRAERGVSQSWWQRTLLGRRARALAARGARREDLHAALADAVVTRAKWVSLAETGTRPSLPADAAFLDTAVPAAEAALTGLDELTELLGRETPLDELPFASLTDLLDRLASDEGTLYRLPRLRELHDALTAQGLTDLLAQLTEEQADVTTTAAIVAQRSTLDPLREGEPEAAEEAEAEPAAAAEAADATLIADADAEPEAITETAPEADLLAEAEPADAELATEAEPEPIAAQAELVTEAAATPVAEPEPEAIAEVDALPQAAPAAEAELDLATEPEQDTELAPEAADADAAPTAEAPAEPDTDATVGAEPEAAAAAQGARPDVVAGKPVGAYAAEQLEAIVRWIDADGVARSDEELLRAAMKELGFSRLGPRIKEALGAAVAAARG